MEESDSPPKHTSILCTPLLPSQLRHDCCTYCLCPHSSQCSGTLSFVNSHATIAFIMDTSPPSQALSRKPSAKKQAIINKQNQKKNQRPTHQREESHGNAITISAVPAPIHHQMSPIHASTRRTLHPKKLMSRVMACWTRIQKWWSYQASTIATMMWNWLTKTLIQ